MSQRKLFGTDGVRGQANTYPMTAEMALRLGAAAGRYFRSIITSNCTRDNVDITCACAR